MSDSAVTYDSKDYFYLDLIHYAIFKNVFSQEKFKNLVLRGSHLTRSLLYGFGDEMYKLCRNPNDMDFFYSTPDDILPQEMAYTINDESRRVPRPEYRHAFDDLLYELVQELETLDCEFKFNIDPLTEHKAEYPFQGEVNVSVSLQDYDVLNWNPWVGGKYPSRKIKSAALIKVWNDDKSVERDLDYSIDIGSGDLIVCPPTSVSIVFPGLSPELAVNVPAATVSLLTSFKIHSAIEKNFDWRVKDFYDLNLLIPHVDPSDSHFKANLYLAFASQGDKLSKVNPLVDGPYDSYLSRAWFVLLRQEKTGNLQNKFEPMMKRIAQFLRIAL